MAQNDLENFILHIIQIFEPHCDKTNRTTCLPSEDSDQPGHPPSLIRVFAVHMKKADAQADLSLRWAHILLVLS